MVFVGIDWAEAHHDVCVVDEEGKVLAKRRVPEGLEGVGKLHALVAEHAEDPAMVVVGIETDRGLLVGSLVAAGYQVYAINPLASSRYRDRHATSGAKSDPGDARVLADLVRTDRHKHRPLAGDSNLAEAVQVLARAHQGLVWTRQRQTNQLRNALREFYPGALAGFDDLDAADAVATLLFARAAGSETWRQRRLRSKPSCDCLSWRRRRFSPNLSCTRTPRSTSVCLDSVLSSAPGLWPSSVMTEPDSCILRLARAMRAPRPSPRPPVLARSFSPRWRATAGSPMPATNGRSLPSLAPKAPGIDTTSCAPAARLIIKLCELWPTVWSPSCMAA